MEGYRGLGQLYPVQLQQPVVPQAEITPYELGGNALGESQIARGIRSAFGSAKAGLQGYGASIADVLGAQQTAQDWYANANAAAQQAELDAPRVRTIGAALESPGNFVDYAGGVFGQVAPYLLLGGGAGLVGRGLGAVAGLRGAELARAGHLAGAASFQPVMAGQQALQMHNDPAARDMTPGEIALRSQGVGAVQAGIEAAVPNMMVGQVLTRTAAPTIGRTLGTIAKNSLAEGTSEGVSDVIGQMHQGTYDPGYRFNPAQTGEAVAAGIVGGAPITAAHGVLTHGLDVGVQVPGKALDKTQTEIGKAWDATKQKASDLIDILPDEAKVHLKSVAAGARNVDEFLGGAVDVLTPVAEHLGRAVKDVAADFWTDLKGKVGEYKEAHEQGVHPDFGDAALDTTELMTDLAASAKTNFSQAVEQIKADPNVPDTVKSAIAAAKGKEGTAIADAMEDPGKWFEENLDAEKLKKHMAALKNPMVQRAYLDDIVDMLNEHGQTTAAADQIRALHAQVKGGTPLSKEDAAAMYVTAKLALEADDVERGIVGATKVFSNTRASQAKTGKTIPGAGEVESVEYAKSGESFHANSFKAALAVAGTSAELATDIARRVQLLDIIGDENRAGRGADLVVREAVTNAFVKHGIKPEANRAFTEMYDKVLAAVNKRLADLRADGSIKAPPTAEELGAVSDAFKGVVRGHIDEMLDSSDAGKQLKGSAKIAESVADFVGKLALGHPDYTQRAATRVFTQILSRFGEAGRGAIDNIIASADDAFGGDSRAAGRVGMLRENVDNIYDVAAAIGKTVKKDGVVEHASGNQVPNYKLISELLADLDTVKRVDSKRDGLINSRNEALAKRKKSMDFEERETLRKHAADVLRVISNYGLGGLRERWVGEGIVDAKKFQSLVGLVEKYDRHGDRLDRPERKHADHVKSAGRSVEDISAEDPDYLQAVQEGASDSENPITPRELSGRMGDERDEFIQKRYEEVYGSQGDERKPARFVGSEIFDSKTYDPKKPKLGAPVTRHPSGDYGTSYNSQRSEYTAMVDEAHSVYGHALTDARGVRMDAWAEEMSNTRGGTIDENLNDALEALLLHDKRRLKSGKLSTEDAEYIQHRAEMAARLKDQDEATAGSVFFASPMNRNYRYYRVEQGDNSNLAFTADQLKYGYSVPEGMTAEQYGAREAKRRGPFAPQVYEDSLMPVEFTDGTRLVDVAKLVGDVMQRHQIADTAGVGDKRITPDKGDQILNAFYEVMGTLMTTDGVVRIPDVYEGGRLFVSEDAPRSKVATIKKSGHKEDFTQHFDPGLVIIRVGTPHKSQVAGEPVSDVAVKNFFTLGQLNSIAGMDAMGRTKYESVNKMTLPVTDKVKGQKPVGPGAFRKQDMSRIMTKPEKVTSNGLPGQNGKAESMRAKKAREDGNKQGVAVNGLTRVATEKVYDKHGTLVKPFVGDNTSYSVDVHKLLVRMLERNNIDPHEALVEGNFPVDTAGMFLREAFQELKTMGYDGALFDKASTLFDGLVVFTRYEFEKNNPVTIRDMKDRGIFDEDREKTITTPRTLEDAKLHEVFSDIADAEKAGADADARLAAGERDLSLTSPDQIAKRAKAIEEAWSRTEWGLWRDPAREKAWDYSDAALALGQLVDHLGGTKDIPLFDKAAAVGGDRSVDRRHRITGDERLVQSPRVGRDVVQKLYERLGRVFKDDPAMTKFLEDTFFLNDKEFEKWLDKRDLKPGTEPQRAGKANNVSLSSNPTTTMSRVERAQAAVLREEAAKAASRAETEANAQEVSRAESEVKRLAEAREAATKRVEREALPSTPTPKAEALSVDVAAIVKDFSSRKPTSVVESQRLIRTLSDEQLREFSLSLPTLRDAKGTAAEQVIRMLSSEKGLTSEWSRAQRERAGVRFDGQRFRLSTDEALFSKQQKGNGRDLYEQEADEITRKLLGDAVTTRLVDSLGVDADGLKIVGRFASKLIEVSRTGPGQRGTLHHEIWHAVEGMLKEMGPHGEKILADIHKHMDTPLMRKRLMEAYADEGVNSQLGDMSERAAFVFQKLSEGVKFPMIKETTSLFGHLADFVKWVASKVGFKTTTAEERSNNFMDYVMRGDFARDMDNAASVRKGLGEKNGDNIVHQAGQILKPGLEALSAVFQHTSTRIADLKIPEYDTVMELLAGKSGKGGYMNDKGRMERIFDNEIGNAIKGMSEEQMQKFRVEKFGEFQGKVEQYMRDAGVEPHQVDGFYKRLATLNADMVGKEMEAFITDLIQHGGFKDKAGEARTLANQIADRGFYYNKDRDLFPNRPDLKEKWAERDFAQAAARYIRTAVELAEKTRERDGNDGKKYRMNDLGALLEAGHAKAGSAGQKLMEDTLAAYNGTLASDKLSPGLRKFMGSLLFINNVRILPKAVFSQMLEPLQLAARRGTMSGTLDTLWRGIREMPRSFDWADSHYTPDKWEQLANQIGTAPSRIIANVMAQMQNGMTLPGKIGHWNDQFFKLNFMDQWNRSMHIEATKHGVEFLKEHAAIVRTSKNKGQVEHSQRLLNDLGVKASDIKVDGDGGLFIDYKNVGSDRVARAISQFVNEGMAHPDAGSNPMWMNDPRWALLAQMKRFTFAHAKYVLDPGIREYKLGNAFPVIPAVIAMPWMMAADGLRDTITMADTSYKNNWGFMDYAEHAWARSGNAGRGQFFGDVEQSVRHGGSGLEGVAGPTAELFGRIARGAHTGQWFDSMVNQVPGAQIVMPD